MKQVAPGSYAFDMLTSTWVCKSMWALRWVVVSHIFASHWSHEYACIFISRGQQLA